MYEGVACTFWKDRRKYSTILSKEGVHNVVGIIYRRSSALCRHVHSAQQRRTVYFAVTTPCVLRQIPGMSYVGALACSEPTYIPGTYIVSQNASHFGIRSYFICHPTIVPNPNIYKRRAHGSTHNRHGGTAPRRAGAYMITRPRGAPAKT